MMNDILNLRKLAMEELESRELLAATLSNALLGELRGTTEVASLCDARNDAYPAIDLSSVADYVKDSASANERQLNSSSFLIDSERAIVVPSLNAPYAFSSSQSDETPSLVVTTSDDIVDLSDGMISLREAVEIYSKYYLNCYIKFFINFSISYHIK